MSELSDLIKMLRNKKPSGSDYTGTVTRVDGNTAYVRLNGSDIMDTPVSMTMDCKPGDRVRVRVNNGKAWITGNDTLPPSNEKKEVVTKMAKDMSDRAKHIIIRDGSIEFLANTLIIDSNNFKLDKEGNAVFSGDLDAAGGSFSGELKAASGSFNGTLTNRTMTGTELRIGGRDWDNIYRPFFLFNTEDNDYAISMHPAGVKAIKRNSGYNNQYSELMYDGVHTSSDKRLKKNISDADANIAKLLRPVSYAFKGSNRLHYGFIAQEVQEVLPGAITETDNGYLMLNYQELIAPLTALVLDQEKRIAALEAELAKTKENES